jgi:putative FmdB family regulatory protein
MPLYEYLCDACGQKFELIRKFSDPPLEECPACGGTVRKLVSSPAFQFKGSGWYITDYARKGQEGQKGQEGREGQEGRGGPAASGEKEGAPAAAAEKEKPAAAAKGREATERAPKGTSGASGADSKPAAPAAGATGPAKKDT